MFQRISGAAPVSSASEGEGLDGLTREPPALLWSVDKDSEMHLRIHERGHPHEVADLQRQKALEAYRASGRHLECDLADY